MSNDNQVSEVRTSRSEPEREQRIFTFTASHEHMPTHHSQKEKKK